ncbi:MAG: cytochrome P450 [Acidimicrobiia bacterium]
MRSDLDLWSEAVLADPLPAFRALRDAGPAVWLERHGVLALPRHAEVRAALADWEAFSSAAGVSVSPEVNAARQPNILESDPPEHDELRRTLAAQLSAPCLAPERDRLAAIARELVDAALARTADGAFDGAADLARPYSLRVVSDLLGLPEEGRSGLPELAERAFNLMGPTNERSLDGLEAVTEIFRHAFAVARSGCLAPGSKGAELVAGGEADKIAAYTWPGIDTTVLGVAAALHLFARHPDQWALVREDPSLAGPAFAEALRLHTPVKHFSRLTTGDVSRAGLDIPAGTRVLVMYGSANRDERRYADPDRFDVTRNPTDHLGFGRGIHLCVGIHLARLEASVLLAELVARVERFEEAGPPRWLVNNTLHGLASLPLRAVPAGTEPSSG